MTATAVNPRWTKLRPVEPAQQRLCESTARFDVIEAGRRCLAEGTLVATPAGPRPIELLKVGDVVIGFDGEKPVLTTVTATWDNGTQEVASLESRHARYLEATGNHRLWGCLESALDKRKDRKSPVFSRIRVDALSKRTRVRRVYLGDMIAGGWKSVPSTYSLGAMLGDGCCLSNKTSTGKRMRNLYISSEDAIIPQAVALQLGCQFRKLPAANYSWQVQFGNGAIDAIPFYREWCSGRYAHQKVVDVAEIDTWDRDSCLGLLAGIIDTDGSVYEKGDGSQVVVQIGMQARSVIEACRHIILKFFQEPLTVHVDNRGRYKNGPVYSIKSNSNDLSIRILEALRPHLRKKWRDTSKLQRANVRDDRIGLLCGARRTVRTFDITVAVPTNLYVLHVGGIVTSNSGKTELVKRLTVLEALRMGPLWAAKGWTWTAKLCAPTHKQACDIFWDDLLALTKDWQARPPNITDRRIFLVGGAELWVCGLDKPERIEGSPVDRLVVDELANVKQGAWDRHLYPALATAGRAGRAYLLGVPRPGEQFDALATLAKDPTATEYAYHNWSSERIVGPKVWAEAKRRRDPILFAQEWEGKRVGTEGRAYYSFLIEHNTRALTYDPRLPLLFAFDFNWSPGVAVVSQEQALRDVLVDECVRCGRAGAGSAGDKCRHCVSLLPLATCTCVIGEVHIPSGSNTTMVCTRLGRDWAHHKGPVICFGDATGGAKKSSSVEGSDWDLIRAYLGRDFPQATFEVDRANPAERARVNAVNFRACNAAGERRLFVDPQKAPNLLRDLNGQLVVEGGTGELDKDSDKTIGHAADGVGYQIHKLYPADYGPGVTESAA